MRVQAHIKPKRIKQKVQNTRAIKLKKENPISAIRYHASGNSLGRTRVETLAIKGHASLGHHILTQTTSHHRRKTKRTRVSPEYTVTTAHRTHRTTERMKKNQRLQHLLLHRFSTSSESFIACRDLIRLSSLQTWRQENIHQAPIQRKHRDQSLQTERRRRILIINHRGFRETEPQAKKPTSFKHTQRCLSSTNRDRHRPSRDLLRLPENQSYRPIDRITKENKFLLSAVQSFGSLYFPEIKSRRRRSWNSLRLPESKHPGRAPEKASSHLISVKKQREKKEMSRVLFKQSID